MSRQQEISNANLQLVAKLNELKTLQGALTSLSTTNKSNLVSAINEVLGLANQPGGAQINDAVTNLAETWSSTKINTEITSAVTNALEGEDLSDLASDILALTQADNGLVSAESAQTFSEAQKTQARSNIDSASATDMGDPNYDFLAEINSNLSF